MSCFPVRGQFRRGKVIFTKYNCLTRFSFYLYFWLSLLYSYIFMEQASACQGIILYFCIAGNDTVNIFYIICKVQFAAKEEYQQSHHKYIYCPLVTYNFFIIFMFDNFRSQAQSSSQLVLLSYPHM